MSRRRPGYSVAEVLTVLLLMSVVLVVVFSLWRSGSREQAFLYTYADLADQTRRALGRLSSDIRSAQRLVKLDRNGSRLERLELLLPGKDDPRALVTVVYDFDAAARELRRDGRALVRSDVRAVEVYPFDEIGRAVAADAPAELIATLRFRFELGPEDAPPGQQRRLDLTLAPRVPASRAKADRVRAERALDRFHQPGGSLPEDAP